MSAGGDGSVVIVGAGVIGLACAHYLVRGGRRVTLIDQATVSGACSHGNCGYICPSHVLPLTEPGAIGLALKSLFKPNAPFRVKPRFSPALIKWMLQFARRCTHRQMLASAVHLKAILDSSMAEYRQLVSEQGIDCEWNENGLLYVLRTASGLDHFAKMDELIDKEFGVKARQIAGAELPSLDPALRPGLGGGFLYDCDTSLRPDVLGRNWLAHLRKAGVEVREHCRLETIRKEGGRIVAAETSAGELEADQFVIAAGAWSATLAKSLECRIPIQPGKGYSLTMRRPNPCPQYPILFPEHKVGVTPFQRGYRLGSMMEFAGFDTRIPPRRIQQLRDSAAPYLHSPYNDEIEEEWFGWRPMTWDSLPIIGRTPRLANAWLATGHNMLGLSLAPATGRLLAEQMNGEAPHIEDRAFSPNRF